jgi:AcrR family transcriptional regulator
MARTKSASVHRSILDAALARFAEHGIDATSMDAVARAAGVSKATLYAHWADKDALALEALSVAFGLYDDPPPFDSGDLRRDFIDALTYRPVARHDVTHRLMPHVVAYASRHRAFGEVWRERAIEAPQRRLRALIARGIRTRALRAAVDDQTAMALLLGPMLYWHIFSGQRTDVPIPRNLAAEVVDAFWARFALPARSHRPARAKAPR